MYLLWSETPELESSALDHSAMTSQDIQLIDNNLLRFKRDSTYIIMMLELRYLVENFVEYLEPWQVTTQK